MYASELYEKVSEKTGFNKETVKSIIEAMTSTAMETAKSGEPVRIAAMGTMKVRDIPARMANNPRNPGEKIAVPAHKKLVFQESMTTAAFLNR